MTVKHWIAFAYLIIVSPPLIAQTASPGAKKEREQAAPAQSPQEWQRKYDMALKYPSLEDFYDAMKQEAASKPKALLPDRSGILLVRSALNVFAKNWG